MILPALYNILARGRAFGFVLVIVAAQMVISAATPADYRERVEMARLAIDGLYEDVYDADVSHINEVIGQVKQALPATERVDWPGGSVETDNRWLAARLSEFTDETDEAARLAILTGVSERLMSIADSVKQLDKAATGETTKDESKRKLAEILRREEYQKAQPKEKSIIQKWVDDLINWLARAFPRPSIPEGATSGLGSLQFGLQILVYALVIALLAFLIYKLAPLLTRSFARKRGEDASHRVILGERIEADESADDLFGEAERLAREGNLRAAIRKGYIALLCELSDRKVIRLARHKTNRDYLRDIRKDETLFENVNGLTRTFERNWYGLRPAAEADWEEFRGGYLETVARIKR